MYFNCPCFFQPSEPFFWGVNIFAWVRGFCCLFTSKVVLGCLDDVHHQWLFSLIVWIKFKPSYRWMDVWWIGIEAMRIFYFFFNFFIEWIWLSFLYAQYYIRLNLPKFTSNSSVLRLITVKGVKNSAIAEEWILNAKP